MTERSVLEDQIHWLTLRLALPAAGIKSLFPTEATCRKRLEQTRWSDGVRCGACLGRVISTLKSTKQYKCNACGQRFSLTANTIMHRSKYSVQFWFRATETFLIGRKWEERRHISLSSFERELKLTRPAAVRLRNKIINDLSEVHGGLLGAALSYRPVVVPVHVNLGSEAHFDWLQEQALAM